LARAISDTLPVRAPVEAANVAPYYAAIVSRQHPTTDT